METQTERKTITGLPKIIKAHGYASVKKILVLGCGGTGGHVIPNLARLVSVANKKLEPGRQQIELYLSDGDMVEEKNLIRQHFISSDINRNKAEVMADRYSGAFGLQITAIPRYIEKQDDINIFFRNTQSSSSIMIIGCVDNNATRKFIHELFNQRPYNTTIWIDSGNEETAGQVVCGINAGHYGSLDLENRCGKISLPCATELYPSLLEVNDKFSSQLSCAERAVSSPQNMFTNVTAAALIMNFASKLINNEPLTSHAVDFSINNVFNTRLNTLENLKTVNRNRLSYQEIREYDKASKF